MTTITTLRLGTTIGAFCTQGADRGNRSDLWEKDNGNWLRCQKWVGMKTNNGSLFEMNNLRCERKLINDSLCETTLTL